MKNLLKKKKIILLRSAMRRGIFDFSRQLYFSIADTLLRRKYLVFYINLDDTPIHVDENEFSLDIVKIENWNDVPEALQGRLESNVENIEWGSKRFFERGRELWALQLQNEIAVLGWLGFPELEKDYIWPVPKGAEILHQLTVLPEFRGKRLQVLHRKMLMTERSKNGVNEFYISCHEYNSTSHKNILRMGFRQIGYSQQSRFSNGLTFHPKKARTI